MSKEKWTDYRVTKIADNVYVINEFNLTTMFLIIGTERALVIDCGTGVADFKSLIEKMTDKPYDVVCTHGHVDHVGGRGQFDKIYISKIDVPIVKKATANYRRVYHFTMKTLLGYSSLPYHKSAVKKIKKEPELIGIDENFEFNLGNKTIKVMPTSGHTLGSIALLDEADSIMFTGDAVNPLMVSYLPHGDTITNYIKTAEKIQSMTQYKYKWASHFESPISDEVVANVIKCSKEIVKRHKGKNGFLPIQFIKKYGIKGIYKGSRIV